MSNTFDKLSVLDSFIEEVNSYLPEIETNLERLAQSPGDMDALEETYRRTHTIGGSASMMDFPGLAHVAHGMEDILGDALDGITTLDEPVLGLLQRSLGRLHQLLEGIRNGVDEEAVIAEDDADYSHYRALIDAPAQSAQPTQPTPPVQVASSEYATPTQSVSDGGMPTEWEDNHAENDAFAMPAPPMASAMPSFDEVLASFRTPNVETGDDVAWPEEPAPDNFSLPSYAEAQGSSPPHLSALDALMASTRPAPAASQPEETFSAALDDWPVDDLLLPESKLPVPIQETDLATQIASFSQVYADVQHEAQNVEQQAAALKNLVAQLRSALSIIDMQRSEFKGFLDGSKDALDRMEDWAGRAMGLNLRNSPEQVRRYLPLSVMWVANSKLKKVLDQLNQTAGDAELADERMEFELQQLRTFLSSSNNMFQQIQERAARVPEPEPTWTPWEMQREQDALRERVTFERYGNPEALRAEIEAQVREEYESRSIPSAASRAELEQQIRSELRKEYEDLLRLQVRATSGQETPEVLQELEDRLRGEIEIQVRQDFLKQITSAEGEFSRMRQQARDTSPSSVSNYVERASEATERFASQLPASATQIAVPEQPLPAAPSLSPQQAQLSSFAADLGEEATEIFRAEAEEHLQTISMHVAALEKTPQNLELIQAVRRATHTLKGAAGMMGFRAIADLCHIFEDLLDSIMEGKTGIASPVLSLILDTAEALDTLITGRDAEAMTDEVRV
ncbi:MAG TPA: Hpt domain-containing protein, partial [Ktedonobacteraceae bacterium]|nr:Hpt domain-containing protein [Ktedonobacteraceae bacterium]